MNSLSVIVFAVVLVCGVCAQNCDPYNSCTNCTANGCNWCLSYSSQSFCTDITSQSAAGCTGESVDDQMDQFITSSPQCYGGCGTAEYCSDCSGYIGCGWCHDTGNSGCIAINSSYCQTLTVGTCELPCNARDDCMDCTGGMTILCSWCPTDPTNYKSGTCVTLDDYTSGCWNETSVCPSPPGSNGAAALHYLIVLLFVSFIAALL